MHQDARYNCGNFKACFDSLRSVQLFARIDALNLVIHLKSAVTLRPVLIVIGFKNNTDFVHQDARYNCGGFKACFDRLRSVQLVARIDALNLVIHLKSAVTLRPVLIVIGFKNNTDFVHQDARYNCGGFKAYFDRLRSVQLVAQIMGIN